MINIISKYQKGDSQNLFTTDVYTVELHCVIVKNTDGFSSDYKSIQVIRDEKKRILLRIFLSRAN